MQFDSSFKVPFRSYMEIVGTEGTLIVPNPFKPGKNNSLQLNQGNDATILKLKGGELYMGEVDDMCDAILKGTPPRVSLEDSRANVAVIVALLKSAQTGGNMAI